MVYAGQQLWSASEFYKAEFMCQTKVSASNFGPVTPRCLLLQVETDVLGAQ